MGERLLRVQDGRGRGPWRPGFSHIWTDPWRTQHLPPIYEEIANFGDAWKSAARDGYHLGCAARESRLRDWFSPFELYRLFDLGFSVVDASDCKILIETPTQVLIMSRKRLRTLPRIVLSPRAPMSSSLVGAGNSGAAAHGCPGFSEGV